MKTTVAYLKHVMSKPQTVFFAEITRSMKHQLIWLEPPSTQLCSGPVSSSHFCSSPIVALSEAPIRDLANHHLAATVLHCEADLGVLSANFMADVPES